MRKILLSALILLCCISQSQARMNVTFGGGGVPAGTSAETYEFFYNADHPTNTETAYTAGGTGSISGTEVNTITQPVGGTDPGTASSDGGNVGKVGSATGRIRFPITSGDIFSSTAGLMSIEYYATASAGNSELVRAWGGGATGGYFLFNVKSDNTVQLYIRGWDGANVKVCNKTSTATWSDSTWTTLQARWKVDGETCGVKVGANAWEDGSCESGYIGMQVEPTTISVASDENGISAADLPVYFDAWKMWTTYDGS